MNNENKTYIGTYKVVKIFRLSQRRIILEKGLTREEAKRVVKPRRLRSLAAKHQF